MEGVGVAGFCLTAAAVTLTAFCIGREGTFLGACAVGGLSFWHVADVGVRVFRFPLLCLSVIAAY